MRYLLDTNMAIYAANKIPRVLRALAAKSPDDLAITTMSVAEMRFGACNSDYPKESHENLTQFLIPWNLITFDEAATWFYGRVRLHLRLAGTPIGERDMIIASIALSRKLVVVTHDSDYLKVPGLKIEDWYE